VSGLIVRVVLVPIVSMVAMGCAAKGASPIDVQDKTEALEGAVCFADGDCDRGELCDFRVCIPEGPPCPAEGVCRAQTHWYDDVGADIPDFYPEGIERPLLVDRPTVAVASAQVSVTIRHTWRGDLRVVLRSPAGTEHVLHDRSGGGDDDLLLSMDVTAPFEGEPADGVWTLRVSDHARSDIGRLEFFRLTLGYAALPSDPPDPGSDVWATVELPSTESAHPYTNDTDLTTDLRRFSGGAARARIRFDRLEVERGYDVVVVVDLDTGDVLDSFTGTLAAFTTRAYETGSLGVRLMSDYSVTAWGYRVGAVEVFGKGCLEDADCPTGTECPNELVRCIAWPCFLSCRAVPVTCVEGETTDDGCNTCTCAGGAWACTERHCPPARGEGDACDGVTLCGTGLTCDRFATEGPVCVAEQPGVCVPEPEGPRFCRALYAPVCGCNGQTFDTNCERIGMAPWAHAGECRLDLAIPDANAAGIASTIHVGAPRDSHQAVVDVRVDHTWRGDLTVWVEAPNGSRHVLTDRAGGSADDFEDHPMVDLGTDTVVGAWTLHVSDHARFDTGVLRHFNVRPR
jgi:subtilisin-like proprotein convertase family protein